MSELGEIFIVNHKTKNIIAASTISTYDKKIKEVFSYIKKQQNLDYTSSLAGGETLKDYRMIFKDAIKKAEDNIDYLLTFKEDENFPLDCIPCLQAELEDARQITDEILLRLRGLKCRYKGVTGNRLLPDFIDIPYLISLGRK